MAIYYLCRDDNTPSGGRRVAYRHVDILNANGVEAAVMHQNADFRLTWFENNTRAVGMNRIVKDGDVVVIPETWGPHIHKCLPEGIPFVIFNQNAYYTFSGYDLSEGETPYTSPDLLGVMCVSEDSRHYLHYAFPHLDPFRVHVSISPLFQYSSDKQNVIACMPRRRPEELAQALNICKWRGELAGWSVDMVDGRPQPSVVQAFRQARVFLSTGYPEGSPMPPLEALASGCVVVGYLGKGGNEYTDLGGVVMVDDSDIIGLAGALAQTLAHVDQFDTIASSRAARERYSPEQEETDVLAFWEQTL